jgi:hypothetical protein
MARILTDDQVKLLDQIEHLPDTALVDDDVAGLILGGITRWTVNRIPDLPRIQVSERRHRRRLGDLRKRARGEHINSA